MCNWCSVPRTRSENRASEVRKGWLDNMVYHLEDILTDKTVDNPNPAVVKVLDVGEPIIALFDNGDKTRETHIYCKHLKVGSVLLLHDWEHLGLPQPHWEMTYSFVKVGLHVLAVPAYVCECHVCVCEYLPGRVCSSCVCEYLPGRVCSCVC